MSSTDRGIARSAASRQRGVVLFVALIVLVVMALMGVAMVRQSGSGLTIAGNIGMRQNALSGADLGTEAAVAWWRPLVATPGALDSDLVAQGYFSDWGTADPKRATGDPTQYDWAGSSVLVTPDDGTGNEVRYIVERLCKLANQGTEVVGQQCVESQLGGALNKSGTCDNYPQSCPPPPMAVHFRVSSRVTGPRKTVSYIQVMLVGQA